MIFGSRTDNCINKVPMVCKKTSRPLDPLCIVIGIWACQGQGISSPNDLLFPEAKVKSGNRRNRQLLAFVCTYYTNMVDQYNDSQKA